MIMTFIYTRWLVKAFSLWERVSFVENLIFACKHFRVPPTDSKVARYTNEKCVSFLKNQNSDSYAEN